MGRQVNRQLRGGLPPGVVYAPPGMLRLRTGDVPSQPAAEPATERAAKGVLRIRGHPPSSRPRRTETAQLERHASTPRAGNPFLTVCFFSNALRVHFSFSLFFMNKFPSRRLPYFARK